MLEMKYDIECETQSPEHEFYRESYILLEGAILEILSRLDIIRKYRVYYDI
jgi:putative GTP pyrophosphokinase